MKILLISCEQYPFFVETINYLDKRGYELYVFCSKEIGSKLGISKLSKGVKFYDDFLGRIDADSNRFNILRIPFNSIRMRKIIKKIKPDLIHAFNLKWSGWISAMSGFHPFVLTGLGSDILIEQNEAAKNIVLKYLRHFTVKRADLITVVSQQMDKQIKEIKQSAVTQFFAPGSNKHIYKDAPVNNGFSLNFENNKIIFSPRKMRPIYQIEKIVLAFHSLKKKLQSVFLILGGYEESGYSNEIKNLIEELNLKDSILLIGRVEMDEWLNYYRVSDVVVSYPSNDGMPATIFEAMSIGRPLVVSDTPSVCEIVRNKYDAIICDRTNPESLSEGLFQLLSDNLLRAEIVKNANETFQKYGDAIKHIDNLEMAYRKLVDINN